MHLSCDHCPRTAEGSETELLDTGWARIIVSTPFRRTFTACPDHAKKMVQAAFAAIEAAGGRRASEAWRRK